MFTTAAPTTAPPEALDESLEYLREDFQHLTGRLDLSTAQVDRYLNRGQKFLDIQSDKQGVETSKFVELSAGRWFAHFTSDCTVIREVWLLGQDQETELTKLTMKSFRQTYPGPINQLTSGTPLYYCPALLRTSPNKLTSVGTYAQYFRAMMDNSAYYNGLIIGPPPDAKYTLQITGRFYTEKLSAANPRTFWSVNHRELLIQAARRALEDDYRNREGRQDIELTMAPAIRAIDLDTAEEDAVGIDCLEG